MLFVFHIERMESLIKHHSLIAIGFFALSISVVCAKPKQIGNLKELDVRNDKEIRWVARLLQKQSIPQANYMLKLVEDYIKAFNNGDFFYENNLDALLDVLHTLREIGRRVKSSSRTNKNQGLSTQNEPIAMDQEEAIEELIESNLTRILQVLFKGGKSQFANLCNYEYPKIASWKINLFIYLREYGLKKGFIKLT